MVGNSTTQKTCLESEGESLSLSTDIYARRDKQVTCGTPRGLVTPFKLEILQTRTVVLEDYLFFPAIYSFSVISFWPPRGESRRFSRNPSQTLYVPPMKIGPLPAKKSFSISSDRQSKHAI